MNPDPVTTRQAMRRSIAAMTYFTLVMRLSQKLGYDITLH